MSRFLLPIYFRQSFYTFEQITQKTSRLFSAFSCFPITAKKTAVKGVNMEYTDEQITQDTKIINWLIRRKIKNLGLSFLADDMRQVAHIKLWELRTKGQWKSDSYAIACAYYTMLNVWRKDKKHCEPQSLDCIIFENTTRLEKTQASRISNDDFLYGGEIRKIIKQIQSRHSLRNQRIIEMFLLEYKQREIAETVNLSQSFVNQCIREFKQELANKLGIKYRGCK